MDAGPWRLHHRGYAVRSVRIDGHSRTVHLARFLLGLEYGDPRQADHRSRATLDNRRANLRIVTQAVNRQNLAPRSGASSRYRGVSLRPDTGRWQARAKLNGKQRHLGFYATEDEAAEVAKAFRLANMPGAVD